MEQFRHPADSRSSDEISHRPHLHRVHDFRADGNGTDNYDCRAGLQTALRRQIFQRGLNRVLRVNEVEFHDERRDAPAQGRFVGGLFIFAHRINGRVMRAHPARVLSHVAMPRENQDRRRLQFDVRMVMLNWLSRLKPR